MIFCHRDTESAETHRGLGTADERRWTPIPPPPFFVCKNPSAFIRVHRRFPVVVILCESSVLSVPLWLLSKPMSDNVHH
jgi:hypothetical protein